MYWAFDRLDGFMNITQDSVNNFVLNTNFGTQRTLV